MQKIMKHLRLIFIIIQVSIIPILTSCSDFKETEPSTPVDIYIAGQYSNGSYDVAVYWLNGKRTNLSAEESYASSIWVDGSDIYVGGAYKEGEIMLACYWKNSTREDFSTLASGVKSIMLSKGNVYAAGSSRLEGMKSYTACYWKNKIKTNIWDENATAKDIYVVEDEVYIAGTYYDQSTYNWVACYWKKNGQRVELPGEWTVVSGIQVVGSDVYVSGNCEHGDYPIPCYWKNRTRIIMEGSAQVYSLFVSGSSVYAAGAYLNSHDDWTACYWKDGKIYDLPGDNAGARDIAVIGCDIYAVGNYQWTPRVACYWLNGNKLDLDVNAYAAKVFVKPI